jgi:nitrogen regulatory protein PII
MPQLIVLVLPDPGQCDAVLHSWLDAGVTGMTLLDSSGVVEQVRAQNEVLDDMPLMPSMRRLLRNEENPGRTMFSVVGDDFDIDSLVAKTEAITGPLKEEGTGFLFVVQVSRTFGLRS